MSQYREDLFISKDLPPVLSQKEIENLAMENTKESIQKIVEHNIRLAINAAYQYGGNDIELVKELIAIANLGLVKAAHTYDSSKSAFSTYAGYCIRNEIFMYFRQIKRTELIVSFDECTTKDGSELRVEDLLAADFDLEEKVISNLDATILKNLIDTLSERERLVVLLHLGFHQDHCYTEKEIAEILGISRSYVSKIYLTAIKNLRKQYDLMTYSMKEYTSKDEHDDTSIQQNEMPASVAFKISPREAFSRGLSMIHKDNEKARLYFQNSMDDPNFSEQSIQKIVHLDFLEGNYAHARSLLQQRDLTPGLAYTRASLENIEYNFDASKRYYQKSILDPDFQYKSLLSMAKLNVQIGEYKMAFHMLQTLLANPDYFASSTFRMISLYSLLGDYEKAFHYLETLDCSNFSSNLLKNYYFTKSYLNHMLGKEMEISSYMQRRILDDSDELLIRHVQKHKRMSNRYTTGCFIPEIDFSKLLSEVRDKMKMVNPNHFEMSDFYCFQMDHVIGYKGDIETKDIALSTILGTDRIITMYPVLLSNEFDSEGYSHSKKLALKRKGGM